MVEDRLEPDPAVEPVAGQAVRGSVAAPKSVAEQAALAVLGDPVVERAALEVLEALAVLDDPAAERAVLVALEVLGDLAAE